MKQTITTDKLNRIHFSLQKLAILSKVMIFENQEEIVDADFRIPYLNNFARRIGNDCQAIQEHLKKSGKLNVKVIDNNFAEDYSGEIWRVVTLLCGLDLEIIKEVATNLEKEMEAILA